MRQQDVVIADFEKNKNGFRIKVYWFIGFFSTLIATIAVIAAWPTVVIFSTYFVIVLAAFVAIIAIAGGLYLVWLAQHEISHKRRRDEAETKKRENESSIITHDHNHVAYCWRNDQLLPIYVPQKANLLPASVDPSTPDFLDFYTVMTQEKRCFAIVADQQTGKTRLAHYLVEHWMSRGIKPLVISQKYDAGEYHNCEKFGPDADGITTGFEMVKTEAAYRQQLANNGVPYREMTLQPVFLEDFTSLYTIIGRTELEQFVAQALTVYAARGLLLYFVAHSRDKAAFGLNRQGAALKDQMTRLEIIPAYDANGKIDHTRKQIVCSIGTSFEAVRVIGVPSHSPNLARDCQAALYHLALPVAQRQPEISPTEATILRRYDRGDGISAIAAAVFGIQNSHNNGKVKETLAKYGREIKDQRVREDVQL